jgi:hypothetical protein
VILRLAPSKATGKEQITSAENLSRAIRLDEHQPPAHVEILEPSFHDPATGIDAYACAYAP